MLANKIRLGQPYGLANEGERVREIDSMDLARCSYFIPQEVLRQDEGKKRSTNYVRGLLWNGDEEHEVTVTARRVLAEWSDVEAARELHPEATRGELQMQLDREQVKVLSDSLAELDKAIHQVLDRVRRAA